VAVVERLPLQPSLHATNSPYLRTKAAKMGHLFTLAEALELEE
jgi:GTP cyclohydrolase II